MVVVLENYRGFQIRKHERYFEKDPLDLGRGVLGIICVYCPEGTEDTYTIFRKYCFLSCAPSLDESIWSKAKVNPIRTPSIFIEGPCDEDGEHVIGHGYWVGDKCSEEVGVTLLEAIFRNAIDSLWNETIKEFPEEFRFYDNRRTPKTA